MRLGARGRLLSCGDTSSHPCKEIQADKAQGQRRISAFVKSLYASKYLTVLTITDSCSPCRWKLRLCPLAFTPPHSSEAPDAAGFVSVQKLTGLDSISSWASTSHETLSPSACSETEYLTMITPRVSSLKLCLTKNDGRRQDRKQTH